MATDAYVFQLVTFSTFGIDVFEPGPFLIRRQPDPWEAFPMFVVYAGPRDYPDMYVVRRQYMLDGFIYYAERPEAVEPTLARARRSIPDGLARLEPAACDDPVIAELWL